MALTQEEKERFLRALEEDPLFLEEVRRRLGLVGLQRAIEDLTRVVSEGFARVWEAIAEHSRHIAALTERMERMEAQLVEHSRQIAEHSRHIAALTERMERMEAQLVEHSRQIDRITRVLERHERRLGELSGIVAAIQANQRVREWLGARQVTIHAVYPPYEVAVLWGMETTPDEILQIRTERGYLLFFVEATYTLAWHDIQRVASWVEEATKRGLPAVGLVYFFRAPGPSREEEEEGIPPEKEEAFWSLRTLQAIADEKGVLLMQHGSFPRRPRGWAPPQGHGEPLQIGVEEDVWL